MAHELAHDLAHDVANDVANDHQLSEWLEFVSVIKLASLPMIVCNGVAPV